MEHLAGWAAAESTAYPLYPVRPDGVTALFERLSAAQGAFLKSQNFNGKAQSLALLPGPDGIAGAVCGLGTDLSPFAFGGLSGQLPPGTSWRLEPGDYSTDEAVLGFLLGAYGFDQFKRRGREPAQLAATLSPRVAALAEAVCLARDLINTPANVLGPAELAAAILAVGQRFGAQREHIHGEALRARYPTVAAVGEGSSRGPEVVVLRWTGSTAGPAAPLISLCGKGVCFDTGGYDLKPSAGMLRMKKDMGGGAIMLGVAQAVMALDLPIRLELRVGCVENSVSGHAMRPSDILQTKAGHTVEIGNTDAEGRLVLCDLLAEAALESPAWLINAATLTGAARVALGPDLPALFCNDEAMAEAFLKAGSAVHDPLWRLPLFPGYESWLDSPVADFNNVSSKPLAGAIIAALFLQRFVPAGSSWAHIDVYAWNDATRPGRPEGGEAQSLRAVIAAIESLALQQL